MEFFEGIKIELYVMNKIFVRKWKKCKGYGYYIRNKLSI